MTGNINSVTVGPDVTTLKTIHDLAIVLETRVTADEMRTTMKIMMRTGIITIGVIPSLMHALTKVTATKTSMLTTDTASIRSTIIIGPGRGTRTRKVDFVNCTRWMEQRLPVFDFAGGWLLRSNYFVAVEQTERIKGQLQLNVHRELVFSVVAR